MELHGNENRIMKGLSNDAIINYINLKTENWCCDNFRYQRMSTKELGDV